MKIEGNRPDFETPLAGRVDATKLGEGKATDTSVNSSGADQVRLSPDALLASNAVAAAKQASDIRPEAVERGRALLQSGKLGADAEGLADALIDRALGS